MTVSRTTAIERIARVIAGQHASVNAGGEELHAAHVVDLAWKDHRDTALAILKTLREPDLAMARVGDIDNWRSMITEAIGEIWSSYDQSVSEPTVGASEN